jgi:hypothetical protein
LRSRFRDQRVHGLKFVDDPSECCPLSEGV